MQSAILYLSCIGEVVNQSMWQPKVTIMSR